jgi:hypothetical protein
MPIFKFKISWVEDDNIQRDIEINSSQNYFLLHNAIKIAFGLKEDLHAKFFLSNDNWQKGREICSKVEKNIKDAVALSCIKTPIGALINEPNQRFIYLLENDKEWHFYVELIIIEKDNTEIDLPRVTRTEGISPSELIRKGKEVIVETDERFDLESNEGFGDEGEDNDDHGMGNDEQSEDITEYGDEFNDI